MNHNYSKNSMENLEKSEDFITFSIFWSMSVPDQKFLYISPDFFLITGYKLKDVYLNPKLWFNLIQNYDKPKFSRKVVDDKIYFESGYSFKNAYGEIIEVEETIFPIIDESNQLIQIQGHSKMKIEDKHDFKIINDIKVPYFIAEKFNCKWKITAVTEKFKKLFDEAIQSYHLNSGDDSLLEILNKKFEDLISKNKTSFEYKIEDLDSEKFYKFELTLSIDNNGNEKIFGWATDITDIKLNEIRLHKLNKDKNKLLSIVSHDLKSPFNTILNFINLLNEGVEIDEEQKREYLKFIYDTSKQQIDLIHDLLDWTKVEAGLLEFCPNFISFNSLISKILSSFGGQIYQKGIEIIQDFDKDLKVFFDRNYLKIVLSNIISNAIKFSHRKGKIIISAKKEIDFIEITIQDFGIGFSQRYFDQIANSHNFELQIGTMGEKGTGLGLKFCYDIITSNHGKLSIESESKKGTKVVIKIRIPKITGVFLGEEKEISELKNFSCKILPDVFLFVCKDIFEFFRFVEEYKIDFVFVNVDLIKDFQRAFLERIFSELSEKCKIIGFSNSPEDLESLKSIIKFERIEKLSKTQETIKEIIKVFLKSKEKLTFSKTNNYQFKTDNPNNN